MDRADTPLLLFAGEAAAVIAVLLLRAAWGLPRRSLPLLAGAWALLATGVIAGALQAGAWGMAMVSVVAITAALAVLIHSVATAPAGKTPHLPRHRNQPAREPLRLGGRLLTFALTVPCALLAALALALGSRAVVARLGASEADGNVLALFLLPVGWATLATLLLMWPSRRAQSLALVLPALAGSLAFIAIRSAA